MAGHCRETFFCEDIGNCKFQCLRVLIKSNKNYCFYEKKLPLFPHKSGRIEVMLEQNIGPWPGHGIFPP
jgi:hypothetical protein